MPPNERFAVNKVILAGLAILLTPAITLAQSADEGPSTTDLGFLVGTWNLTHEGFDITNPGTPGRAQTGLKVCAYDLEFSGTPTFIRCETTSSTSDGSQVKHVEYINYNPEAETFEKANFFNIWPVKVIEAVRFDGAARVVEIRGRVALEEGLETYVEYWRFNEDYSAFDREAWMNLPSFPLTEFRQTIAGRGVKVAG